MIDNIQSLPELVRLVSDEVHPVSIPSVYGVLNNDLGIEAPFGNIPESEMPSERAVLRIRHHAEKLGIRLNTAMPALNIPAADNKPFTAGILLPDTPKELREEFTNAFTNAASVSGLGVKLVFRYYPPHFGEDERFYVDDFYGLLNSMAAEKPDIYIVYPIRHNRFRDCAMAIAKRKPLILFDGIIMNSDFALLEDTAYVGPDYYSTALLASMAVAQRIADSDFCGVVTPHIVDTFDQFEKVPLTEGFIDAIRSMHTKDNKADIGIFHTGFGIYNTPAHLTMSVGNYYMARRDLLNEKALSPDCKVRGVGVIFTHEGTLHLTLEALKRLDFANDRFLSNAMCVGINGSVLNLADDMRKRISLLVNHDRNEECLKALTVAANRLHNGFFDEDGNLATFTNCRFFKYF